MKKKKSISSIVIISIFSHELPRFIMNFSRKYMTEIEKLCRLILPYDYTEFHQ